MNRTIKDATVKRFYYETHDQLRSHLSDFVMAFLPSGSKLSWPHCYEPWTTEMEVFHNPFARHPASFELLPEAQHWFLDGSEWQRAPVYEKSILWSQTIITDADKPMPTLQDWLDLNDHT